MAARVQPPFKHRALEVIGTGHAGIVSKINENIVVKSRFRFDKSEGWYKTQEEESREAFEIEVRYLEILAKPENWHPNIVLVLLYDIENIFLQRAKEPVAARFKDPTPIPPSTLCRWISELAAAGAWLERLQIAHCDLRLWNILIDDDGHLKLCDFDSALPYGQPLPCGEVPFYKYYPNGTFGTAGAETEQFAIGSCIYTMFMRSEPIMQSSLNQYPSTVELGAIGPLVQKCWAQSYTSLAELKTELDSTVENEEENNTAIAETSPLASATMPSRAQYDEWVEECRDILQQAKAYDLRERRRGCVAGIFGFGLLAMLLHRIVRR